MSNYRYISPNEFVTLIDANRCNYFVVDCRGDDRDDGYINGAAVIASNTDGREVYETLLQRVLQQMQERNEKLKETNNNNINIDPFHVIFHCALSQVRGPKGAGRFAAVLQDAKLNNNNNNNETLGIVLNAIQVEVLRGGWENFLSIYHQSRPDLYTIA
ncbi:Rhodanese-like domain containing protein, putative [Angomonas deanei]|uniref:Rhodanese-like domain containing protein, putative n=1 Tax=Angomonas deanei TaxID=59799 RepID=A0A7G2CAL1_9TRYP|nr:Rhodanese-like domain containing protein, putative [Angomonas deanei]